MNDLATIDLAARRDAFLGVIAQRRALMGILNVTPDSFSDGGRFDALDAAIVQAQKLVADGADIVDVGAESTRPGHTPISAEDEIARLDAMLPPLLAQVDAPFSIDTYKAATARWATRRGVAVVNDIWGLQKDPGMADAVAEAEAAVVIMHNRDGADAAIDIVADIRRFFDRSLDLARRAGIPHERVMLDPGIGFGKTRDQNLRALRATDELVAAYGLPILIGVSRKSMFGLLLGAAVDARLIGTLAANLATAARGARTFLMPAVREISARVGSVVALSSLWRTPPWGVTDQPAFANACALVETRLAPYPLLAALKQIEADLGRAPTTRWGPRVVDIDILFYGDAALGDPELTIPHRDLMKRAFVLAPLAEIAAERDIGGINVRDALARVDQTGLSITHPGDAWAQRTTGGAR